MIQAVIFDMDGLMFDTESAYSIVHENMSARRGKVFTIEMKHTLMSRRIDESMKMLNEYWGVSEKIEDLVREQDEELIHIYNFHVEKMFGLDNLIHFLNEQKIRKCIATSSRRFLVDILLKKHNLENEFEFIVTGDDVEKGKPDPEIYRTCLAKLNLTGEECLVLEDSVNGMNAGITALCKTCAVPSLFTSGEDFSSADIVAQSLDDEIIKKFIRNEI